MQFERIPIKCAFIKDSIEFYQMCLPRPGGAAYCWLCQTSPRNAMLAYDNWTYNDDINVSEHPFEYIISAMYCVLVPLDLYYKLLYGTWTSTKIYSILDRYNERTTRFDILTALIRRHYILPIMIAEQKHDVSYIISHVPSIGIAPNYAYTCICRYTHSNDIEIYSGIVQHGQMKLYDFDIGVDPLHKNHDTYCGKSPKTANALKQHGLCIAQPSYEEDRARSIQNCAAHIQPWIPVVPLVNIIIGYIV
jgi:hypothetical protein